MSKQRIDEYVKDEILRRRYIDFVWFVRGVENLCQRMRALQNGDGVRQELLSLLRQGVNAPRPTLLAINLHAQPQFKHHPSDCARPAR